MEPTTSGRFRVQRRVGTGTRGSGSDGSEPDGSVSDVEDPTASFTVIELPDGPVAPDDPDAAEAYAPLLVEGDHAVDTESLEPGFVVDATIGWTDGTARFLEYDVVRRTRIYVADDVTGMFEAATEAWEGARAAGESVVSTTARGQDGEPNGALYVFSEAGARDLFGEFRSGTTPLEPLVERVNDDLDDDPREVFVLRPPDGAFVVVYIAFEKDGLLARTVRDTYL